MSVLSVSLAGRFLLAAWRWLEDAWRFSAVRRAAVALRRAVGAAVAGSALLSVRGARVRPLSELAFSPVAGSLSARFVGRLYLASADVLGAGPVGRAARAASMSSRASVFARGGWLRVAGAGIAAGGCAAVAVAKTVSEGLAGGVLVLLGLVALVASFPAVSCRLFARKSQSGARRPEAAGPTAQLVVWLVVAAAACAGAVVGTAGAGPVVLLCGVGLFLVAVPYALYRGEALLIALAAFPWLDFAMRKWLGAGLGGYWDEAFLLLGLGAAVFGAVVLRRYDLKTIPGFIPFLIAFVLAVGSVAAGNVPNEVAQFALRITFQPLLFYVLGLWLPKDGRSTKAAIGVFLAASLVLALHGLYQYATNAPMPASWVDTHEDISTRAYSIVGNPNGLGSFLLLSALLAGSLALSPLRARVRAGLAGVTLVLLAGLAVTFSRGAYLGLACGFVALVLLGYRQWLGRLFAAAVLAVLLVPRRFLDRLLFGFSSYYLQLSQANGRLYVWRIALLRMLEHPWTGVGLGTLGGTSAYLAGYSRLWTDNYYLQLASEGGLLLLLAFVWMLVRAGKGLVAAFKDLTEPWRRGFVAGVFGGFVGVCVSALTISVWETLVVAAGFWFLVGLASSQEEDGEADRWAAGARATGAAEAAVLESAESAERAA